MNENKDIEEKDPLEQEIINAIRARGLKEAMQKWDEEDRKAIKRSKRRWKAAVISILSPVAVAAVLAGVVFLGPASWQRQAYRTARHYAHSIFPPQQTGSTNSNAVDLNQWYAMADASLTVISGHYTEFTPGGCNSLVYEAVDQMRMRNFHIALGDLNDAEEELSEDDPNYDIIMDDIEYLTALCEYMLGNTKKATKQLKAIAAGNGIHKADAKKMLKK